MATFEFDQLNDGSIDEAFTIDASDNGFNATNSQLILGGGNGLIFDNIGVTLFSEPFALNLISYNGTVVELEVGGLDTNKTYVLTRSVNLQDGFPTTVGSPFIPTESKLLLTDSYPPVSDSFFYRVEGSP